MVFGCRRSQCASQSCKDSMSLLSQHAVTKITAMTITLYGITNCDTVKKARAWLADSAVDYKFHDFKKQGVPPANLDRWLAAAGWEKLLNRQGTTWRKLDAATQQQASSAAGARALMLEQSSVIKRPVVEWSGGEVTVGFNADDWEKRKNS